jgi:Protein of unknown function (DUF3800)
VRFIFLDEGGISKHEPFVVVAGPFVDGDKELIPLENHLEELVEKHIPEEEREGFVFHTKDIWTGAKYFRDRQKWPIHKRVAILDDLVRIPETLELPIVCQFVERARFPFSPLPHDPADKDLSIGIHAVTFAACSLLAERIMRKWWPSEVAQLVSEDNDQARATIKEVQALFRNGADLKRNNIDVDCLPLTRIRGSVHFAVKSESKPLQLADVCAFFIRGHLAGHPKNAQFYDVLKRWMIVLPKTDDKDDKPMTAWPYGPLTFA